MIQESGLIEFEDLGDYFCKIETRKKDERYSKRLITHKAMNIFIDGIEPGCHLITCHHDYIVVSVDRNKETLGLIIIT